ncbi:Outer membrane protein [uncultured Desulfobacterium sp.]|uniref:Outer membrane protein n=1 Tax=uncultured Desulfobacterium sp. TaxID=201089 RepID=A0A445N017_9BACT|nr:Outer membrane protein [uncultured Desulfobacterium sp.]
MKYFIGLVVGIIWLFSCQAGVMAAEDKIGIVDLQKFQQDSTGYKKLSESYVKKLEPQKQELEKKKSELIEFEDGIKKQSMMLSLDAKEDKRKEYEKMARRYKYLENEYYQAIKEAELEVKRSVLQDVAKLMDNIGKKDKYLLILEKGSSGILYNSDNIDITDDVIKEYDRMKK